MRLPLLLFVAAALFASGCASRHGRVPPADVTRGAGVEVGVASWMDSGLAGHRTASGERYDPQAMTAAHRELPFGSRVRVTNLSNGRSVTVRINDRGPFRRGRIVDVSRRAARELGLIAAGTARVRLEVVGR